MAIPWISAGISPGYLCSPFVGKALTREGVNLPPVSARSAVMTGVMSIYPRVTPEASRGVYVVAIHSRRQPRQEFAPDAEAL